MIFQILTLIFFVFRLQLCGVVNIVVLLKILPQQCAVDQPDRGPFVMLAGLCGQTRFMDFSAVTFVSLYINLLHTTFCVAHIGL